MLRKQPSHFSGRFDSVDALRGFAMVWMTAFHFSFDLNQFGYIRQDFYRDPVWTTQRTLILSLFLFCAGLGQALAVAQGQTWARFWRRWGQVVGCAVLVTASSWVMYPQSFIYFGVLHGMALMLVLARCLTGWGNWLWVVGAGVVATKFIAAPALQTGAMAIYAEYLNTPVLNWLGLITRKPVTEDYVPLLPWFGVMLWGVAAGNWLIQRRSQQPSWARLTPLQPLVLLGRWSLTYYMLHQPVMIGLLMAVGWATH